MPRRSPSLVLIHIVWATSGRRAVLPPSLDDRLLALFSMKAKELRCVLVAGGCARDHVHVVVRLAASASLADLVMRMKGASAYSLNRGLLREKRLFWQDGYWAESIAPEDLGEVVAYVRAQRDRHDDSNPRERWSLRVSASDQAI